MSKFFNETLKTRGPGASRQRFDLAGLDDVALREEPTELQPIEPDVPPPADQSKRVEIPKSILIPAQFEGSESVQSAEEAYRALRTRLLRICSERDLHTILLTSSVPGEGKTLTSLNLALSCSQLHENSVLLVDGDIRTAGLTQSIGAASLPGLGDVLSGQSDPDSIVRETNHPALWFFGAGSTSVPAAELFAGDRWQEFVQWSKKSFKLILIDCPPVMGLSDVELMTAPCDGVAFVVRAGFTRRDVLQKASAQIDSKKFLGLIYNVSDGPHHKYYYARTREKYGD